MEAIRYVDLVIPETCWEQKRSDVKEYHIDTFVIGDDWKGKFDFLREERSGRDDGKYHCKVL